MELVDNAELECYSSMTSSCQTPYIGRYSEDLDAWPNRLTI